MSFHGEIRFPCAFLSSNYFQIYKDIAIGLLFVYQFGYSSNPTDSQHIMLNSATISNHI